MHESVVPPPQIQQEDMALDEQYDASSTALREALEVIKSGDGVLVELAESLGIEFEHDGLVLSPQQRWILSKKCLATLGFEQGFENASFEIRGAEPSREMTPSQLPNKGVHESIFPSLQLPREDTMLDEQDCASDALSFALCEEAKEPGEEILEEAMALGKRFNYDGSVLTLEQRRAVFKKYWAEHLKLLGMRSPKYYGHQSYCISVEETVWPGAVTYIEAEKLKRSYFTPEDLAERLRKLKPSHNFKHRKFPHPRMSWEDPTPLREEGIEISPPYPDWVIDQLYAITHMGKQLGRQLTDQRRQELKDRWAQVELSVELMPLPDLHLLREIGRSPGGTIFPWYLVKGLMALRDHANVIGGKLYNEEYESAEIKRQETINCWKERYPDSILADDPLSIYTTWPADLMNELNQIDREAIRCGRRNYVTALTEAEKKMQALVTFWRICGLVTGQRIPPSSWWQDPKSKVKQLTKPQYLNERLNEIETEFGYQTDMGKKLRMIEMSRWMESIISDSEPTVSPALFPQSLLAELDIVWRDRDWLDQDDTEDEMIARIRQWKLSRRARRLPRIKITEDQATWHSRLRPRTKAEIQTSWRDRLRRRPGSVDDSCHRSKTNTQTGKPRGIIKRKKASRKRRSTAQPTTSTAKQADPSHRLSTESHFNESSSQAIPGSVTYGKRTSLKYRSPRHVSTTQLQGVQKTRHVNRRQHRLWEPH